MHCSLCGDFGTVDTLFHHIRAGLWACEVCVRRRADEIIALTRWVLAEPEEQDILGRYVRPTLRSNLIYHGLIHRDVQ